MANNIQLVATNITDNVIAKVGEMEKKGTVAFPRNYSYANALKSAQLVLLEQKDKNGKPVLESCSKESIVNSLLSMVTKGLNVTKNQCYFVPYGNQLQLMVSYMGKVAMIKRMNGIKDVKAYALYENDVFKTEFDALTGRLTVKEYNPSFENIDKSKIKGAFAMIIGEEGVLHTEVMNMVQIVSAWKQGAAKGNSGAHQNFGEEMAKKTVINRAVKMYINTSDDSDLDFGEYEREEYKEAEVSEVVKEEIKENANTEVIDIEPEEAKPVVEADGEEQTEIAPSF